MNQEKIPYRGNYLVYRSSESSDGELGVHDILDVWESRWYIKTINQ